MMRPAERPCFSSPSTPEPVEDHRQRQLARDRGGRDAAGAERACTEISTVVT